MPVTKAVLDHLNTSYKELSDALAESIIGKDYVNLGKYALTGCSNAGTGLNYDIAAGWIMYSGTMYAVDAATFTASVGQVAVASFITTYDATDPLQYSGGNSYNTMETKKIKFAAGASGSGLFDYSDLVFCQIEASRLVGASGQPAYQTGWDDGGFEGIRFRKNREGKVTVQARFAANGTPAITDPIFILPSGYRPAQDIYIPGIKVSGTGWVNVVYFIDTSGNVFVFQYGITNYTNNDQFYCSLHFYNF